jgi:hypothetical protein
MFSSLLGLVFGLEDEARETIPEVVTFFVVITVRTSN